MKQHYLPKAAYLRFFEAPGNPGCLWLYRRGQEPILVSTEKVAKESHLYSFLTQEGELSTEVEGILGKIEDEARPILQQINAGKGDLRITAYEEIALATFAAFQAARLPARQRETGEMLAQVSRWLFQSHVANVPTFQRQVDDMIAAGKQDRTTDAEKLRAEILAGRFEITPDEKFVMATLLEGAEEIVATFLMKRLTVLRSESECFLTSDYPVVNMPIADHPPMRGVGFINSHVFMPVGTRAGHSSALWLAASLPRRSPPPRSRRERYLG